MFEKKCLSGLPKLVASRGRIGMPIGAKKVMDVGEGYAIPQHGHYLVEDSVLSSLTLKRFYVPEVPR